MKEEQKMFFCLPCNRVSFFNGEFMILSKFINFLKSNETIIKIITFIVIFLVIVFLCIMAYKREKDIINRHKRIEKMVATSIFSAMSIILYLLKFNLPTIFPSFLEIQFSNVPALIGSYMFGSINGLLIVVIRTIIKLPSSHTFCVGELADLLISSLTILISSTVFHKNKEKTPIIKSLIIAIITWVIASIIANALIIAPLYISIMDGGIESFVGMLELTMPSINNSNYMFYYLTFAILPFNIVLSFIVCLVTFFVYKRIHKIYNKIGNN